jgi:tRNA pseudouridine65 synthase
VVNDEPIAVLYRDVHCAIINKPCGLMAHASSLSRGEDDFLLHRLRTQWQSRVHLIHRLDRATSGCLLVAFDAASASMLGKALMAGEIRKDYLAICRGWPEEDFIVDHALDGGPGKPEKKPAVTAFKRLAAAEIAVANAEHASSRYALMRCSPITGRFRQIRRHLKHVSHHLIGDTSHGDGRHNRLFRMHGIHRMLLHASRLDFVHPMSGQHILCNAPLDDAWIKAMHWLGWHPDNIAIDAALCRAQNHVEPRSEYPIQSKYAPNGDNTQNNNKG